MQTILHVFVLFVLQFVAKRCFSWTRDSDSSRVDGVLTRLQVSFHLFLCVGWKQKIPQNITKNLAEVEKIVYVYHWHHWPK